MTLKPSNKFDLRNFSTINQMEWNRLLKSVRNQEMLLWHCQKSDLTFLKARWKISPSLIDVRIGAKLNKRKCQNPAGDKCHRASISFPNHQFSWPSAFQKSLNYIINLIRCFFQIKDEESFSFSSRHKKPRKSPLFLKLKKLQFSAFLSWHFGVNPSSILRRRNGKFDFIEFHA